MKFNAVMLIKTKGKYNYWVSWYSYTSIEWTISAHYSEIFSIIIDPVLLQLFSYGNYKVSLHLLHDSAVSLQFQTISKGEVRAGIYHMVSRDPCILSTEFLHEWSSLRI